MCVLLPSPPHQQCVRPPSKPSAPATGVCVDSSLDLALQKQAPTYGAIPSAADLKKQKDSKEDEAAWKEDVAYKLLQPDALLRLNKLEQANPAKVSTCLRSPDTPCLPARVILAPTQADEIKAQLFLMASRGDKKEKDSTTPFSDAATSLKPGSVTDSYLQTLIEAAKQASGTHHPQRALHRRF